MVGNSREDIGEIGLRLRRTDPPARGREPTHSRSVLPERDELTGLALATRTLRDAFLYVLVLC
jgi:hypothetical protein